jgi:response regulator RpfG family c-di-GMP phosphodiesterase
MFAMDKRGQNEASVLVVARDVEEGKRTVHVLEQAGYDQVSLATGLTEALSCMESHSPSLLILVADHCCQDLCASLRQFSEHFGAPWFCPILVLYDALDLNTCREAVALGADEFVRSDVDGEELLLHIDSLLGVHLRSSDLRQELEAGIVAQTKELERAQLELVGCLGKMAELRDMKTGAHIARVGRLSGLIAHALHLPPERVALVMHAAPLHDIGKAVLSDQILLHARDLDDIDREMMQRHTYLGAEILAGGSSEFMKTAREIAACHHERWDGHGYPSGLRAEEIPLSARIVSVADAFDAMTDERPYRRASSIEDALATIRQERGWQFDPEVVDALFRVLEQEAAVEPEPAALGAEGVW